MQRAMRLGIEHTGKRIGRDHKTVVTVPPNSPMTKTVFIKAPVAKVYAKSFQWLSLQDYEIVEQVKEQKIVVRPPSYGARRIWGLICLIFGVIPGILILLCSVWTLTITFVEESDGVFVTGKAQSSAQRPLKIIRELAGVLSFLS